jgi:NADH-quinone oxidoreductase subunit N
MTIMDLGSAIGLLALAPMITLTVTILVVMMVIAFARNLALTCLFSVLGLMLTLASIGWVSINIAPGYVTPLIVVDPYALLFSSIIVIAALLITLIAYSYSTVRGENQDEFLLLLLLSTLGALTLSHSAHFASFILGLELIGVSLYAMISYPIRGLFSLESALKYLILSGVSSALILFGIALLFAMSGSLSFQEMAGIETNDANLYLLMGSTMILSGIAFKLSLVPFHMWTPDVYEGAPAPATAFLATVSKAGIFAVLLRFFVSFDGYQYEAILEGLFWIAVLSILLGNLLAVMQNSIKRVLAYSSIAHLGYLLVAFIAASELGSKQLAIEAVTFFLIAYVATTIGAFGIVAMMSCSAVDSDTNHDDDNLVSFEGLFWRRPLMAAFFSAMLLSLAGIPLTMGFVGKFYIFAAGVESGLWTLLAAVVIGSGIGLFYYLRIIFTMTKQTDTGEEIILPAAGGWSIGVVSLLVVVLGVYPTPVVEWVSFVARSID